MRCHLALPVAGLIAALTPLTYALVTEIITITPTSTQEPMYSSTTTITQTQTVTLFPLRTSTLDPTSSPLPTTPAPSPTLCYDTNLNTPVPCTTTTSRWTEYHYPGASTVALGSLGHRNAEVPRLTIGQGVTNVLLSILVISAAIWFFCGNLILFIFGRDGPVFANGWF